MAESVVADPEFGALIGRAVDGMRAVEELQHELARRVSLATENVEAAVRARLLESDPVMTMDEAVEYTQMCARTLADSAKGKRLPVLEHFMTSVGAGEYRFRKSWLDAWIEACRAECIRARKARREKLRRARR